MNRTPEIFDKIEAYLAQRLDAEERRVFEQEMAGDPELRNELAKHRQLHGVLSHRELLDFRTKVQKIGKEVREQPRLDGDQQEIKAWNVKAKNQYSLLRVAAVAVLVVGLGSILWTWNSEAPQALDLYVQNYQPYPVEEVTRGVSDAPSESVVMLYSDGKYAEAIPKLKALISASNQPKLQLYLGNCYLNTNELAAAIRVFQSIPEKSIFFEDAQWYLALSYLKQENSNEATHILQSVVAYQGVYEKKAKKLLKTLVAL